MQPGDPVWHTSTISLEEEGHDGNKRITWILMSAKAVEIEWISRMDIVAHFQDGKTAKKSVRICKQHAMEAVKGGELKSVTVEDTIDFD